MIVPQSPRPPRTHAKGKLYLQFQLAGQRFALDAHEVLEILPRCPLKPIPETPRWVAGIMAHRGVLVPVLDLSLRMCGQAAVMRTSTRLVLVGYRPGGQAPARPLGLLLEYATETLRCQPDEFLAYGLDNGQAPYLGPVRQDAQGLVQRIGVDDLLPDDVRRLLFPGEPAQVGA